MMVQHIAVIRFYTGFSVNRCLPIMWGVKAPKTLRSTRLGLVGYTAVNERVVNKSLFVTVMTVNMFLLL